MPQSMPISCLAWMLLVPWCMFEYIKSLRLGVVNRILKCLLIIVLAAIAFFGVAIATNANRCERLRQFFSGEPMQWESVNDSADR